MSIDRIAKLLQMAERAKTPQEATAFFAKAQALATAHEISLAEARHHLAPAAREAPVQQLVTVGRPRQQANRHYLRLLIALARSNGCEIGLYNNNTAALLFGLPSDIRTVERLFAAIAPQMIRHGEAHLALGRWRADAVVDLRTGQRRPITRQQARASFYQGFTDTLAARIRAAAAAARAEAQEAESRRGGDPEPPRSGTPAQSGVELALRAKELDVQSFAKQRLGGGTWRGGRMPSEVARSSYLAGDRAAAKVRLSAVDEVAGGRKAVGA
jgi:Protein of unknown function (DUF2786)